MKRSLSGIMLALLVVSMLASTFTVGTSKLESTSVNDKTQKSNPYFQTLSIPPSTEWSRTYGGTNEDRAFASVQTADGGYALAGFTESFGTGSADAWLVKIDASGNMMWSKTYGGTGYDVALSLVQTGDGGYALAGHTDSFGAGNYDFWLVKTDSSGNMMWSKTYGGTGWEDAYALVQTVDGGYALAGITGSSGSGNYDAWLVKTDSAGNMQWNKTYGGTGEDGAYSLVQAGDCGYGLAGYTYSFGAGSADFWLVKTDSAGNMQWNKTCGGTGWELAGSVVQTVDGGYALAGFTNSYGAGNLDFWSVKTAPVYSVTFSELGLAQGTQWSVTFNGETLDSTSNMITFSAVNGFYSFSITPPTGYSVLPSSGSVIVAGASKFEYILFSLPQDYSPQNLVAMPLNNGVHLKWDPPRQSGVQSYYVFRGTSADFTVWGSQRATLDANTREFRDQVSDNTIYYYKVIAVYSLGWSPPSQVTACARLESHRGIRNTVTGITSIAADLPGGFSLQQNFWIEYFNWRLGSRHVLWCQNVIDILPLRAGMVCDVEVHNTEVDPPKLIFRGQNFAGTSIPDTMNFVSGISGTSISFTNSAGSYTCKLADYLDVSGDVYVLPDEPTWSCFVIAGDRNGATAHFTSGDGYVSCKTMIGDLDHERDGRISAIVPNDGGTGEKSTGLTWFLTGHFTHLDTSGTSTDKGVYFVPDYGSSASRTTSFDILGKPMRSLVVSADCPVYLDLYDDQGRCVGYNKTSGTVDFQIDNVFWISNQTLLVFDPSSTYRLEVTGTDNGTYEMETSWQDIAGTTITMLHSNSTITENETQVYTFGADPNVVLMNILPSKTVVCQGFGLQVNATVADLSGVNATTDVTLYANGTIIGTQNALNVSGWDSANACYALNTTGLAYGNYTISAYAWPVPGETNTADNNLTFGWVKVTIVGDVNGDGKVNLIDVFSVALAYGSYPGHPTWNPNYDINNDFEINLIDYFTTALNYGKTDP